MATLKRSGLFWKTILKLAMLFLLIVGTISVHSAWNLRQRLSEEFRSKGAAISNSVANSALEVILNRDASMVQAMIDQYVEISGVGYVFVVDSEGDVIAHTFVPAMPDAVAQLPGNSKQITTREVEVPGVGKYIDVASPMLGGVAGYVHVGMDRGIIDAHIRSAILTQILLILAIFAVSLFLVYLLARSITQPIRTAARVAEGVAAGDLTSRVEAGSGDEIGQLLRSIGTMTQNLNSVVGQVQKTGIQITSTAGQIAATSREQEGTVQDFRTFTNEIAVAARQISATSQQLASTMNHVADVAMDAAAVAGSGQKGLESMRETMSQLVEATGMIAGALDEIRLKTSNINLVVTTIVKIADQTNLLSLNAAIEAEKAGTAGSGFAVVAKEIRRLADQTAVSTLDIEKMVSEMQNAAEAGVRVAETFSQNVARSAEEVAAVSSQLSQVIEKVQTLTPRFEEVNQGSQAQAQGAQQIRDSMAHLSEAAQKTAESVTQFHRITEQLYEEANRLQDEVSRFKVIGG